MKKYYVIHSKNGCLELRHSRYREQMERGNEHPHDVYAVERDIHEMVVTCAIFAKDEIDWSRVKGKDTSRASSRMPMMKYTVIWSKGPYDNPTDGEFEVEASNVLEAVEKATVKLGDHYLIDGVTRTDIWKDL